MTTANQSYSFPSSNSLLKILEEQTLMVVKRKSFNRKDISTRMSEIIWRGLVGLSSQTILVLGPTAALTDSKSPVSIRL